MLAYFFRYRIVRLLCFFFYAAAFSSVSAAPSSQGCEDWRTIVIHVADSLAKGYSNEEMKKGLGGDAAQLIEAIELKLRSSSKEQIADEFVAICAKGQNQQPTEVGDAGMAVVRSPIVKSCAALSFSSPSSVTSKDVAALAAKQKSWLSLFFFGYGEDRGKGLLAEQVSKIRSLSPSAADNLARECNSQNVLDILRLPPISRNFPTDPRWHAEACMAILNSAADEAVDTNAQKSYRVASKKAYFAMSLFAAERVGDEGGTKVFRWLSQRNGGRVGNAQGADIRYCEQYYI